MNNHPNSIKYLHITLISLLFLYANCVAKGQYSNESQPKKQSFASHLYFGGGLGLQFGSMTLIEISPLVGYRVTPKFSIGLSPTYKYYSYKDYYGKVNTNVFGGSLFSRYFIFDNIFAHVEYESLFYNTRYPGDPKVMQQFNSFFVGVGYNQSIGGNAGMYIVVLWNLNDTPNSPYVNPIIRVGFSVGL